MRLAAAIILIAACKEEPSPSRAGDGSSHIEPPSVVVVTKSEISCSAVVGKLQSAAMLEDAALGQVVQFKAPMILAACINDEWPLELRACIASTPTTELIGKHVCDKHVSDEIAQKLVDRIAPGQRVNPRDFLQR